MATAVLSRLTEIRDAYARRRALWRELSVYTTEGDLNDIEAAIARCEADTDPETEEVRRVIASQRFAIAARNN